MVCEVVPQARQGPSRVGAGGWTGSGDDDCSLITPSSGDASSLMMMCSMPYLSPESPLALAAAADSDCARGDASQLLGGGVPGSPYDGDNDGAALARTLSGFAAQPWLMSMAMFQQAYGGPAAGAWACPPPGQWTAKKQQIGGGVRPEEKSGGAQRPRSRKSKAAITESEKSKGFANKLTDMLEQGGCLADEAIRALRQTGVLAQLSFESAGCRAVQQALEYADRNTAAELAYALQGKVAQAITSPHANYVLQKVIKVLTPAEVPFIAKEVSEAEMSLARHEYGCRILCRLLEHAATEESTIKLIDEILSDTRGLLRHTFGHHVVECTLEHGLPRQKQLIINMIREDLVQNMWNRHTSYVIEKAILYGSEHREGLARDILNRCDKELVTLAKSQFTCMIIRALFRIPDVAQEVVQRLSTVDARDHLSTTRHGRRIVDEFFIGSPKQT